jgi:uncharacterized protein
MHDLIEFSKNHIFWAGFAAWFIAQTIKVLLGVIKEKRFNFRWFVGTGGMPSSHTASISALATAIGMTYGFDSGLFALALGFAIVVSFDAQGVRRSSGKQAILLNKMMDDIYWQKKFDEMKLKEFLGHTPVEVFAGLALGVVVALLMYK